MVNSARIQYLANRNVAPDGWGRYVVYWMQQAQRWRFNHALQYAVTVANDLHLPLLAVFCVSGYTRANLRHYAFMLEGIEQLRGELEKNNVGFVAKICDDPAVEVAKLAKHAAVVVTDRGYMPIQTKWRRQLAGLVKVPLVQVESDVVVPVDLASDKREYSAATLRRKITPLIDDFLENSKPMRHDKPQVSPDDVVPKCDDISLKNVAKKLKLDSSVVPVKAHAGGYDAAKKLLKNFIVKKLSNYDIGRNDPTKDFVSHLSPYLHFGQISPVEVALAVRDADAPADDRNAFLEQLIVRRELAMNFVRFCPQADEFDSLPNWAKKTLKKHDRDRISFYTLEQLENADAKDQYWNAAQRQLVADGTIHNYMRMYWGKKILEWAPSAREGFDWCVYLNDKYALDGRDPNSYAGIAWCFGNHDRPWGERKIFGMVRCMVASGLERKFDAKKYATMWPAAAACEGAAFQRSPKPTGRRRVNR